MLAQKLYHMLQVERQQWLRPAELRKLQDAKLRAMVRHAYANVPFYRRAWKAAGVRPEDVRTADDLRRLPVVTRADAKKNQHDMVSRQFRGSKLRMRHTSGSSGTMLRIPLEESSMELREALLFRSGRVAGYRPWKRTVVIYPESPKIRFYERGRKVFIPSSEDERHVVSMLEKFEPNLIVTFPSTASILAEIVEERKLRHIRPEHIITTGELLTPGKRRFIESAFGCDIYDQYGAEEVGEIAWECGMHDGLHISVDSVIVESVDGSGSPMASGEAGDILLTGLSNRAMPFIRYSIGDSGRMKDGMCACGRGLPLMEMLEGRDDEFLRLSSGRLLGPRVICAILDKLVLFNDIVADFKVVQKRDGRITVYVTEGERFSTSAPLKIKSAMKNAISEPADVDVVVMKEMPRLKGGKFKFIVSEAVRRKNKF